MRSWIRVLLAVLASFSWARAQHNTLLILADDVGVDAIGIYRRSATPPPTPHIDALARNGVLFRNAYTNPICSPTRAAIHTGRYCFRTGVGAVVSYGGGRELQLAEFTLPEALAAGGYAHALIGKWHLGDARNGGDRGPNLAGWSHFAGHMWNIKSPETYYRWRKVVNGSAVTSTAYATTDNVNDAITWIGKQRKPWVCGLFFNAAHAPFHAPPASLHTYQLAGKSPSKQPIPFYKAMVQAMDTELGRLFRTLGSTTMQKTNVIFIGDNGTPGRVSEAPFTSGHAKTTLYEGGVHVPLIIQGPAVTAPGREVAALVESVDLFPTVLALSGIDTDKTVPRGIPLDGVSLVPYLANATQKPLKQYAYAERFLATNGSHMKDGFCIRNDRYKWIRWDRTAKESFFDLQNDPFETVDLLQRQLNSGERQNLDALRAEVARLRADWLPFGTGCAGSGGVPRLDLVARATPRIGSTFTTELRGLGSGARGAAGIFGFSRTQFGPFPLPLDLTSLQMPGCQLLVSADVLVPLVMQTGVARWSVPLPNDQRLVGGSFYEQALVLDSGSNPANAVVSDAGAATIGGR